MSRRLGRLLLVVFATGRLAEAQTNDHLFRSWAWRPGPVTARSAGLAGAVTALPDDAGAAHGNPANLLSLVKAEATATVQRQGDGGARLGDALAGGTALRFIGAAARLSSRCALAGYLAETQSVHLRLLPRALPDGLSDEGELKAIVREGGLAASWAAVPRLEVGLRLTAVRASAEGEYRRESPSEPTRLRVEIGGSGTRLAGSLGASWAPGTRFRLAVVQHQGATWRMGRRAVSPFLGAAVDPGSTFGLRQPGTFSAGAAVRVHRKVLATAQLDRIRYGEIRSVLTIRHGAHSRRDYRLADAWEPRMGLEVSFPFSRLSAQLRGGIHGQAGAAFTYTGGDGAEAASFPPSRRELGWGLGGSLVTSGVRLDAAFSGAGNRRALLAALGRRF